VPGWPGICASSESRDGLRALPKGNSLGLLVRGPNCTVPLVVPVLKMERKSGRSPARQTAVMPKPGSMTDHKDISTALSRWREAKVLAYRTLECSEAAW
jgi:hypothetical protein